MSDTLYSATPSLQVMRSLLVSSKPVSLRELSYRSALQIRSTQLAVRKLIEHGIAEKKKTAYRTFIQINPSHGELEPLRAYFKVVIRQELENRARARRDAQSLLERMNELFLLSQSMRASGSAQTS